MKTTPWELQHKKLIQIDGETFFEKRKKSASHPTDLFAFAIHCVVNSSQQLKDVEHIAPSHISYGGVKKEKHITFYPTSEKSETPPPPSNSTLFHHGRNTTKKEIEFPNNQRLSKKNTGDQKKLVTPATQPKNHHGEAQQKKCGIINKKITNPIFKNENANEQKEGKKDHNRSASPPSLTILESYHNNVNLQHYGVDMIT